MSRMPSGRVMFAFLHFCCTDEANCNLDGTNRLGGHASDGSARTVRSNGVQRAGPIVGYITDLLPHNSSLYHLIYGHPADWNAVSVGKSFFCGVDSHPSCPNPSCQKRTSSMLELKGHVHGFLDFTVKGAPMIV